MAGLAFVFPGQGSQRVGMGRDIYETFPAARALFEEADEVLGFSLSELCFSGPEEDLNETVNTQPAIYVTSLAIWRSIALSLPQPVGFFAGHSLGEYAALAASGALDFVTGLRLVLKRGKLMQAAGERSQGGMAAILGLDAPVVESICLQAREATGSVVEVANYNTPGQIVISGDNAALADAMERATGTGARKVVRLAVSIAAHSPLMAPAVDGLRNDLEAVRFDVPSHPVVGNVTARPLARAGDIVAELVQQLTLPVRWTESLRWMLSQGLDAHVEVGPGQILTGLMKRVDRTVKRVSVGDVRGVQGFVGG